MTAEASIKAEDTTMDLKEEGPLKDAQPPAQVKEGEEKRRRAWAQWSPEEIAAFFEALNEHGKDFDAIQNYLVNKTKRKSAGNQVTTVTKNKDQVRHFYYRAWHKISKYLNPLLPDNGKKSHKELYGLINYGEMWKKLGGFFNERCGEKLGELIQHGATTVKVKGKTIRIKTPVCPVVKRLQSVENESQNKPQQPLIPDQIVVELTPSCNADFLRVQSVAHNPRVRVSAESRAPLSDVINFLTKKWKPKSLVESETIAEDEVLLRLLPDCRQHSSSGTVSTDKKTRKRSVSDQEPEEPQDSIKQETIGEVKSWTLDNGSVSIGEVYATCHGSDGRLLLVYTWERRSIQLNKNPDGPPDVLDDSCDMSSLLRALLSISKSCFTKTNQTADQGKKSRRNVATTPVAEPVNRSPSVDVSPHSNNPAESPMQTSRVRQRLRRPLRYGTSLKRGGLSVAMSKLPGPPQRPGQHSVTLIPQQGPSTVNLSWPAPSSSADDGNLTPIVFQMCLNSSHSPMEEQVTVNQGVQHRDPISEQGFVLSVEQEPTKESSVLNTPDKSRRTIEWDRASNAPSVSSTSQKLQEWMSLFLPTTPEKKGSTGTASVRSASISLPESLSSYLADGQNLLASNWSNREGDEISLSSLLNQLVSPAKSTASSRYTDLRLPHDLQSLVADNSVDLTARFAELAACIAAAETSHSSKAKQQP